MSRRRPTCLALRAGAAALSACLASSALAQATVPEIEPNDAKSAATPALLLAPGDRLSGVSTGGSGAGTPSPDYFRLSTAAAPLGVYRHRLVITTSGGTGHTGSIRGLAQAGGQIGSLDVALQSSLPGSVPPRFSQWYGFGRSEPLFYRVAGASSTTAPYFATFSREPITPTSVPDFFPAGPLAITTIGQGHSTDTELVVLDASFTPVPGANNDDESVAAGGSGETSQSQIRRTFAPGVYYLAVSDSNIASSLASPSDDRARDQPVADFPGLLACSSPASSRNVSFAIISPLGSTPVTAFKDGPFDIAWFQFTVSPYADPTPPMAFARASPSSVPELAEVVLTVDVTPGMNPDSSGLAVVVDASQLGGPSALPLLDDGVPPDSVAGDRIFTARLPASAPAGSYALPFTVSDAQARSIWGSIPLGVTPGPIGACCTASGCTLTRQVLCDQVQGDFRGPGTDCGGTTYAVTNLPPSFEDLATLGQPLLLDDETTIVDLPIGFSFRFFGADFSAASVCSNGFIAFGENSTEFMNVPIPSTAPPNNMIAGLWDDLDPSSGGQVYVATLGAAGSRRFIVSFQNVPQFPGDDSNTFQIVLFEGSNRIQIRYGLITPQAIPGDYTVGVENADGTAGLNYDAAGLGAGSLTLEFTPNERRSDCRCGIDLNGDGNVDPDDLSDAISRFFDPGVTFDYDGNGFEDPDDLSSYISDYFTPGFCG